MELIHFYWEFKDKIECCSVFKGLNTVLLCSIVGMPVEMLSIVKEMGGTRGQNGSYSRWYGKPSECEISESGRKCDQNVSSIESNSGRPFCGTVFNIQRSDFFVDLVNESTGHVARLAQYEAWAIAADENPVKLGKCGNAGSSETWYGPGKTSSNYSAQKKKICCDRWYCLFLPSWSPKWFGMGAEFGCAVRTAERASPAGDGSN